MDVRRVPKWVWIAALVAVGGIVWKMRSKAISVPGKAAPSFDKTEEEGGIFTRPSGVTSAPLLIVYGGVTKYDYATKEGMERAMPKEIKLRVFCLFVNYKSGEVSNYVAASQRLAQKYGLTFTDTKIMGFSGGAAEVQRAGIDRFSFVGLIDPYTTAGNVNLPFGANTKMIYRPTNWGGSASMLEVRRVLPLLASAVRSAGGEAAEVNKKHADMPAEFFRRYAAQLVAPA